MYQYEPSQDLTIKVYNAHVEVLSNIQTNSWRHMYQYEPSRDLTIKVYNVHVEVLSNIQTNSYVTCINMNLHGT